MEWKMANVIPLPNNNPPVSIETPISLNPIAAKKWGMKQLKVKLMLISFEELVELPFML